MDESTAPAPLKRRWRIIFGGTIVIFAMCMISAIVTYGSHTNTLHESALSWSFVLIIVGLVAAGFDQFLEILPSIAGRKRD
jgi:hypothetical protein